MSRGVINECSVEDLSGTLLEYKYEKQIIFELLQF